MNIVYLQLGSNIGDRECLLESAILKIKSKVGNIVKSSKVYESSPWRVDGQSSYLNQVIEAQTTLDAESLLRVALEIENNLGKNFKD